MAGVGCRLQRPNTVPSRFIEPQLLDPQFTEAVRNAAKSPNASPIRLFETAESGHIGRRVLHQLPNGELTEDPVWLWSSLPDKYLDTALHQEVESNPNLRLVDNTSAPAVAATLLEWNLESQGQTRLVGAVEYRVTGTDRAIHSDVVRASEPVAGEMPGDLAIVSGRLLRHLASEGLTKIASER
jgi:hypothetical protein